MNNGNQRKNEMKEIENEIVEIEKVDTEKKQKQNCYSEKTQISIERKRQMIFRHFLKDTQLANILKAKTNRNNI